jgi:hypothetical protein
MMLNGKKSKQLPDNQSNKEFPYGMVCLMTLEKVKNEIFNYNSNDFL